MRSMVSLGVLVVVVGVGAFAGYWAARQHVAVAADMSAEHAAGVEGLTAYHSGNYAKAVPLLKKYAESAEVRDDKSKRNEILTDIVDAENKVQAAVAATRGAVDPLTGVAAVDPADVDPSTGKVRVPHGVPKAGEVLTMTIREMGNFEFDPTATKDIPADVKALDGATVQLRGFMIPLNQAEDITDFALVPTLANCCFGQPPGVQHTITCKTEKGRAVQYTVDEIQVTGKLAVRMKRDQDYTYSVFEMTVSSVKVAE